MELQKHAIPMPRRILVAGVVICRDRAVREERGREGEAAAGSAAARVPPAPWS